MAITFVGAGAAVTGNNAPTLSPTLHASTQTGDLILLLSSIGGATGHPGGVLSGWTELITTGNFRVYAKVATASEVTPVALFVTGSAGDDNIAQCATFRGCEPSTSGIVAAIQTNISAQNVAYPGVTVPGINHLIVAAGWKQDDSTGWAPIASYTEIGETNTTTGNDASQAWDYRIETTAVDLVAGSFTVTGGAAAVSKGMTVLIRPTAAISVTVQDDYPQRVLVSLTGLTLGDDVEIYRVVGGTRTLVRAGSGTNVTDPSFLRIDAELPFGVPVSYVGVVNGLTEYSTSPVTYTLDGGKVALTDSVGGLAAEVVIVAWDQKTYDRAATVYKVGGRNIAVTGDLGQFESALTLDTYSLSSAENLRAVLSTATEAVIQLRGPDPKYDVDSYLAVPGFTERRFSQDGSDEHRQWDLTVVEVDGWASALEARGFTLQDIADFYGASGTLADLAADYSTLLDVARGDFS